MAITLSGSIIRVDGGRVSSTATSGGANTLTDTAQALVIDAEIDRAIWIYAGTGAGQFRRILSNTATVFTTAFNWAVNPDSTSQYVVLYNWDDVQAANDTGAWGIITTQANQHFINGDIQFGLGTNRGGLWDYEKAVNCLFPSGGGYAVDRWQSKTNSIWGDGELNSAGIPEKGSSYFFDVSSVINSVSGGINMLNTLSSNFAFDIHLRDTKLRLSSVPAGKFIAMRAKSVAGVSIYNYTSIQGPQFTILSLAAIMDGVYTDGQNLSISANFNTIPSNITAVNASSSATGAGDSGDIELSKFYGNTLMGAMSSSFSTGEVYYITDCVFNKSGTLGLIPDATQIHCTGSPDGRLIERKRVSFKIVDSLGVSIQSARVSLVNSLLNQVINELTDVSGDTSISKIDAQEWRGSSNPGVNGSDANPPTVLNPQILRIREYKYLFIKESITIDSPIVASNKALALNTFVSATEVAANAYLGVSIDYIGKTITHSGTLTAKQIYEFTRADLVKAANSDEDEFFTTADGVNYLLDSAWTMILSAPVNGGINLTGNVQQTAVFDFTAHNVSGQLTFTTAGTYTITNSSITEVINTSGGGIILNLVNSLITTNTGPNITTNVTTSIKITVIDEATQVPITQARVHMEATGGGTLPDGTAIISAQIVDVNGEINTTVNAVNQSFTGLIVDATNPSLYVPKPISGTILAGGLDLTIGLVLDE